MNKKRILKYLPFTLVLLVVSVLCFGSNEANADEIYGDLNLKKGTVVSGVTFKDTSLSGLTPEQALDIIEASVKHMQTVTFTVSSKLYDEYCFSATPDDFYFEWNKDEVSKQLTDYTVTGNLLDRYKKAKDFQKKPVSVTPSISIDSEMLEAVYAEIPSNWYSEAKNASVTSKTGAIVVTPSKTGYSINLTEGLQLAKNAILNLDFDGVSEDDVYYIEIDERIVEPDLTTETAAGFTVIGSYTTNYVNPTNEILENRETNLERSTGNMNGCSFAPGEVVSALKMYGSVTEANGYAKAGTYSAGIHVNEVGGGICQTTTTLYNAVILAELEIVYRHNHSMLVSYVDPALDAMVYAPGGSDFKFKNTSSDYIFIESYINKKNCTVTVNIIGHEDHEPDHTVRYESEVLELILPEIIVTEDPDAKIGGKIKDYSEKFGVVENYDYPMAGCKARCWKITTDNGIETKTLFTSTDKYNPAGSSYYCSPDMYLEFETDEEGGIAYAFLKVSPYYLDGTPLSANFPIWTPEERLEFNETMTRLLLEKSLESENSYEWPYTSDGYEEYPNGTGALETESESESESGSEEPTESETEPEKTEL